jgi:hypothetical protein
MPLAQSRAPKIRGVRLLSPQEHELGSEDE